MTLLVGSTFQASIWIRQQRIKFYHGTRLTAVSHKPKSTRCTRLTEVSVQPFKASASKHSTHSSSVPHCIYTTQGHKQQASAHAFVVYAALRHNALVTAFSRLQFVSSWFLVIQRKNLAEISAQSSQNAQHRTFTIKVTFDFCV